MACSGGGGSPLKRSGQHETSIRELLIRPGTGLALGQPLRDFEGILSGTPTTTVRIRVPLAP